MLLIEQSKPVVWDILQLRCPDKEIQPYFILSLDLATAKSPVSGVKAAL